MHWIEVKFDKYITNLIKDTKQNNLENIATI